MVDRKKKLYYKCSRKYEGNASCVKECEDVENKRLRFVLRSTGELKLFNLEIHYFNRQVLTFLNMRKEIFWCYSQYDLRIKS